MMPSDDASHGNLENLSLSFENLGGTKKSYTIRTPSSTELEVFNYHLWTPSYMKFDSSTGTLLIDESFFEPRKSLDREKRQPVFCSECSYKHIPYTACPSKLCSTCFKTHKEQCICPYEYRVPQGADFDRVNFHLVCAFDDGGLFDENKWACPTCHGKEAKVKRKFCSNCMRHTQHCTYDCPEGVDVVAADEYKALRNHALAFPMKHVPYTGPKKYHH